MGSVCRGGCLIVRDSYAPVVRYPKTRQTVWASDTPEHSYRGQPAGPVQVDGAFYCPAVMSQLKGKSPLVELPIYWRRKAG